jgi:hypothetical protein
MPQVEHDPVLQLEQAADEVVCFSTPDMPKVDGSFSTSSDPQPGQLTDAVVENISFSNRSSQLRHWYSNTGIRWILPRFRRLTIPQCSEAGAKEGGMGQLLALSC